MKSMFALLLVAAMYLGVISTASAQGDEQVEKAKNIKNSVKI